MHYLKSFKLPAQTIKVFALLTIIPLLSNCSSNTTGVKSKTAAGHVTSAPKSLANITYGKKLQSCKAGYPFARWREAFDQGFEQYTEENCGRFKAVFDRLISDLTKLGEQSPSTDKVEAFKRAILLLNNINAEDSSLIETGEREDLCALVDQITIACGLNPKDFGGGEGIASEWREW